MIESGSSHEGDYIVKPQKPEEASEYFNSYSRFSSSLRGWLVAYGIGAPVLFASQAAFARVLNDTKRATPIIVMFLIGVLIQIGMTLSYKYCMWCLYQGEIKNHYKNKYRCHCANYLSNQTWLEFILDISTVVLYTYGTVALILAYISLSQQQIQSVQQAAQSALQAADTAQKAAQTVQKAQQSTKEPPTPVSSPKPATTHPSDGKPVTPDQNQR